MHHMTPCVSPAALLGYWSEVWTLCEALWGRLEPADQDPDVDAPGEYKQQLERRRTFSAWLSCGATSRVEEEVALAGKGRHVEAIFSYLSGNRISDACRLAQREGEMTQQTVENVQLVLLTRRSLAVCLQETTVCRCCCLRPQAPRSVATCWAFSWPTGTACRPTATCPRSGCASSRCSLGNLYAAVFVKLIRKV